MYHQTYNPTGNVALSTLIAAIPILTLLYFIALHPHRDQNGVRHLGISAPYAAFYGVIAAFLVTWVAIAGAVMVGLGFRPFQSAVLNLLANTAPVAWGAIGTPIVTLAAVSGLDQVTLSAMAGRQLPFVSILVPFWLVATFVKMEGGTWKEAFEVWPAALCAGASFALMQFLASGSNEFHLMTDVVSGVFSVVCTALFIRFVWHPKTRFLLRSEREALERAGKTAADDARAWKYKYGVGETLLAWTPWII